MNCIVFGNTTGAGVLSNVANATLNFCCVTPTSGGLGSFSADPKFLSAASGDFRLQSNSPCINSGTNWAGTGLLDLVGNPRLVGIAMDIGAYEYQTPQSLIPASWLAQYNLPLDGSADFIDSDTDGMNNWQEWRADTIPTNSSSVFKISKVTGNASGVAIGVTWQSVATRKYTVQRTTNLLTTGFTTIASNLQGQVGSTSYVDVPANPFALFPWFYRVLVQ